MAYEVTIRKKGKIVSRQKYTSKSSASASMKRDSNYIGYSGSIKKVRGRLRLPRRLSRRRR